MVDTEDRDTGRKQRREREKKAAVGFADESMAGVWERVCSLVPTHYT